MKNILSHRFFPIMCFVLIAAFFIITRLWNIQTSLLYFNDMGRDSLVLLDWAETGKPPLLGPQTSALPFNQSAVYFYLLYPVFVLTGHSPYSALFTTLFFYIGMFAIALALSQKSNILNRVTLVVFFLSTIHPQFIIQNRFVWNPSFVGPLILLAFISFYQLRQKFSAQNIAIFAVSIATAVAMSYSALPVLIAFGVVSLLLFRLRAILIGVACTVALAVVNLPTIFFELRHHFILTQQMLYGEKLPQSGAGFFFQLYDLTRHSFLSDQITISRILAVLIVVAVVVGIVLYRQKTDQNHTAQSVFETVLLIAFLTTAITLVLPMSIHPHYIFGVVTLGMITLAALPIQVTILIGGVLTFVWLLPIVQGNYFLPARRTVKELQRCFAQVCKNETQPMFAVVQAGFHPYHNGPEHRFMLREAGCTIRAIETNPAAANKMAVVLDDSNYEHGQTQFNELSMFGPSHPITKYTCSDKLQIIVLERNAATSDK